MDETFTWHGSPLPWTGQTYDEEGCRFWEILDDSGLPVHTSDFGPLLPGSNFDRLMTRQLTADHSLFLQAPVLLSCCERAVMRLIERSDPLDTELINHLNAAISGARDGVSAVRDEDEGGF